MIAERANVQFYLFMVLFITGVIYPMPVYWVWGGGYLSEMFTEKAAFIDFAGSSVVHANGAFAGLA